MKLDMFLNIKPFRKELQKDDFQGDQWPGKP